MFDKMKALMDMQKKMQEVKRELENTVFETVSGNGMVKISMNGAQEVKDIKIAPDLSGVKTPELEQAFKDALAKALKRSQAVAAEKMKAIAGLNLPGVG